MTDINRLFQIRQPNKKSNLSHLQQFSYQANRPQAKDLFGSKGRYTEYQQSVPNISLGIRTSTTYVSPVKKSDRDLARTTISNQLMADEIEYFKQTSKQQFYFKMFCFIAPFILLGITGLINKKIVFEILLTGLSIMLVEANFFEDYTLTLCFKTLPFLTYLALFYDWLNLNENRQTRQLYFAFAHMPTIILSALATINFLFFRKVQFLSSRNISNIQINLKWKQTGKYFITKYIDRLKNIFKILPLIMLINICIIFFTVIYCAINKNTKLFQETIINPITIKALALYWLLDAIVYSVQFLCREVQFFRLKLKFYQVHAFLSLLRLKSDQNHQNLNQKIHERCLQELAKQLKANRQYLQIPVKINYAISSYRDIFQIYASNQLSQLLQKVNSINLQISKNSKIQKSKKTWKQDLFIYPRQFAVLIQNNYLLFKMLKEIQKQKLIFLIFSKLSSDSAIKSIMFDTMNDIITIAKKSLLEQMRYEVFQNKLNDWVIEIQRLISIMKNKSVETNFGNITQKDEKGWAHKTTRTVTL